MIVLDTNIVLDLLVFDDPAVRPLQTALQAGELQWIATAGMREELARVLDYPLLSPQLARRQLAAVDVLAGFDRQVRLVEAAPRATVICTDPDDQPFIDLAVAHGARLLSKDRAVLRLKKRLLALGVPVDRLMPAPA